MSIIKKWWSGINNYSGHRVCGEIVHEESQSNDSTNCPFCGYPSKRKYKNNPCFGLYFPGLPCDGCGEIHDINK